MPQGTIAFRQIFVALTVLAAVASQSNGQDRSASLLSLVPGDGNLPEWSQTDSSRMYKGEDLFSYIDGGAVLFFEYGFKQALAAEFQNKAGASIDLAIYEMKDPSGAYGIYSVRSSESARAVNFGQEGSRQTHYIMFWKGSYYVSVAGSDSTKDCQDGVDSVARLVDRAIVRQSNRPRVVELLPKEKLVKVKYFRGNLALSTVFPFDDKDVFSMIDGAAGIYEDLTLFLLRYARELDAQQRFANIESELESSGRFENYRLQGETATANSTNGRALCFGQSGSFVVITVSPDEAVALSYCRKVLSLPGLR